MTEEKKVKQQENVGVLVRIMGKDISGEKKIYTGLTKIKGISWAISSAICYKLNLDKNENILSLSKDDLIRIEELLKGDAIPKHLKNRRNDLEDGQDKHITGVNLDMKKEFDIKRLRKIKSYRGNRYSLKLPVRGQRTRSHFRGKGRAVGVKKPKVGKKS